MNVDRHIAASVIIPTHNAASVLAEQLEALLHQVCGHEFEVIVVLNRCSDGSKKIADRFASRSSIVRVLDASEKPGAAYARNVGSRAASGTALLYCDADDVVGPNWVQGMVDALGEADIVGGHLELLRGSASVAGAGGAPHDGGLMQCNEIQIAASCSLACRREVFESTGGWDEAYFSYEDVMFSFAAQRHGYRIGYSSAASAAYRQRDTFRQALKQRANYGRGEAMFIRREQPWRFRGRRHAFASVMLQTLRLLDPRPSSDQRAAQLLRVRRVIAKNWSLSREPPPRLGPNEPLLIDFTIPHETAIVGGFCFVAPVAEARRLAFETSPPTILQILPRIVDEGAHVVDISSVVNTTTLAWLKLLGADGELTLVSSDPRFAEALALNLARHQFRGTSEILRFDEATAVRLSRCSISLLRIDLDKGSLQLLRSILSLCPETTAPRFLVVSFNPADAHGDGDDRHQLLDELQQLGPAVVVGTSVHGGCQLLDDYRSRGSAGGRRLPGPEDTVVISRDSRFDLHTLLSVTPTIGP